MILILLILFLLSGCATTGSPTSNYVPMEETTRASMQFEVEGKKYDGAAVVDRKASQVISFYLPKESLKFMITTCNREVFSGYPDYSKPFKFTYIPLMYLENLDKCFMTATSITSKGETFKSVIEFRSGEELPGTLYCNGSVNPYIGVGLCQARKGLIQRIDFDVPVVYAIQKGCPELGAPSLKSLSDRSFEFSVGEGFCSYRFMDQKKRKFRLTTYGYTSIQEIVIK